MTQNNEHLKFAGREDIRLHMQAAALETSLSQNFLGPHIPPAKKHIHYKHY